ncbi:hypothetical protein KKH30_02520 [Candidatus Micrarchaeota archaeon]|nr:hypothetical protein [Candidatus Micrarchaeota archaeon]MBU1939614.1 hypothetical protein [Candidatus Micrarchaeota archaeon]
MGLFREKRIITKKRERALDNFRKQAVKALEELRKGAKHRNIKNLYDTMIYNVENTPVVFYPRRNLRSFVQRVGNKLFGSVTKGENVNRIWVVQKGNNKFIVRDNYINMPAEHVFDGENLTIDGIFTLSHEYAHFDKPHLGVFADSLGIDPHTAEELMADILSAKLAVKMGYPKKRVLGHFTGRGIVYGSFPFEKYISSAIGF